MIALVIGPARIGKTTVCDKAIEVLRGDGLKIGGVLCPARWDPSGEKTGVDVVDLLTDERRNFARLAHGEKVTVGEYVMDDSVMRWALLSIMDAVINGCQVLVVDEIGPLELYKGGGFAQVLGPLSDPARVPHAVVVVRARLLDELIARLGRDDARPFVVDEENRDDAPRLLADALLGAISGGPGAAAG